MEVWQIALAAFGTGAFAGVIATLWILGLLDKM